MADSAPSGQPKPDLLAIFGPGIYLLTTTLFVGATRHDGGDARRAFDKAVSFFGRTNSVWVLALLLLFFAYLLGSFARAISVNLADKLCTILFRWRARGAYGHSPV